ncbi:MAG: HEAT repeat domain-containing protein [Planctomycetota bacterium]
MTRQLLELLVVALLVAPSVLAQDADADAEKAKREKRPMVAWQPDYEAALKLAKIEKKPLMVAFILRGEPANETVCDEHFRDELICEMSKKFVCLLALSTFRDLEEGETTDLSKELVEKLEPTATLEQLKKVEHDARYGLLESNRVSTPQFFFLKPDGESVLLHHVYTLSPERLLEKMQKAFHFFDPSWDLPKDMKEINANEVVEVEELVKLSDDKNMVTRRAAMAKLAGKDHPMVIEFLIKQTGKTVKTQRRLEAIRAMAQKGQIKFLDCLHKLLPKESSFQIRSNVANAIGTIGLVESAEVLAKAVKKERKDNVRSLLMRAWAKCAGGESDAYAKSLNKMLKSRSNVDRLTALYLIGLMAKEVPLEAEVIKAARDKSSRIRGAAYFAIGSKKWTKAKKRLEKRFNSEAGEVKKACAWALGELGDPAYGTFDSPSSVIAGWLPSAAS